MPETVPQLVDHLFRHQAGRLVSYLVRSIGPAHVDLAEDVVQDALIAALRRWPFDGVPDDPGAWLYRVARNRAIDALRRHDNFRTKLDVLAGHATDVKDTDASSSEVRFADELDDDVLRMIFACSHPSIPEEARGPLTLKLVCGFSVPEVARAFLVRETTMAQRIVRAKRELRAGRVDIEVPGAQAIEERLGSVLEVLYLLFNEGYGAHRGENLVRADLADEAIRLALLVTTHEAAALPQAHALLSLMLLQGARLPARVDGAGRLALLAEQDRSLWNRERIAAGFRHLDLAARGNELSEYHIQAAIAACHMSVARAEDTDWAQILAHYDTLVERFPSPIARLNRTVAEGMVHGPARGLEALDQLDPESLGAYYLLPATRAEFLRRAGRHAEAVRAFEHALMLVGTDPERRFIEERLRRIDAGLHD